MELRIAAYGDPHATYPGDKGGDPAADVHVPIVNAITAWQPEYVIALGDHIHGPTVGPAWPTFEAEASPLLDMCSGRYLPAFGNHDAGDGDAAYTNFWSPRGFPVRYYTVDMGPVGVVVLDAHDPSEAPPDCDNYDSQKVFLQQSLEMYQSKPFRVVAWHRSPYSTGFRGSDVCARNAFKSICEAGKVHLILGGHTHAYERFVVNGIQYVTTGGAGGVPHALDTSPDAPIITMFRVAASQDYHWLSLSVDSLGRMMTIQAISREGLLLDYFALPANPMPEVVKGTKGIRFTTD